jgi:hypothetical protein
MSVYLSRVYCISKIYLFCLYSLLFDCTILTFEFYGRKLEAPPDKSDTLALQLTYYSKAI